MLQPVFFTVRTVQCKNTLQNVVRNLTRRFSRYSFIGCQGCQRQFIKDLRGIDHHLIQIKKFGFTSSPSLLSNYEKYTFTQHRFSQFDNRDPSGGDDKKSPMTEPPGGSFNQMQAASGVDNKSSQNLSDSGSAGESTDEKKRITKVLNKKPIDKDKIYTDNTYIHIGRVIQEYGLNIRDIKKLKAFKSRSPYGFGSRTSTIDVYKISDVKNLVIKKYGSLENMEFSKRQAAIYGQQNFGYDSSPVSFDPFQMGSEQMASDRQLPVQESFLRNGSAQVVIVAIIINGLNCIVKFIAWWYTSSDSMFAEALHSFCDTLNQCFLLYGLYKSRQKPDSAHPYGYANLRNISSLISAMSIFFIGAGLSVYHAGMGFMNPELLEFNSWAIYTMGFSFLSESFSLGIAVRQILKDCKKAKESFWQHVWSGRDPNVHVVLFEDIAAVTGVSIASMCMYLSHIFQNPYIDSAGSAVIGGILGAVALLLVRANMDTLIIRSIPKEEEDKITQALEQDIMIRSVHDVKATYSGDGIRYKAEVDFDGRELTQATLENIDLEELKKEMLSVKTPEDAANILLFHGEKIVNRPGEEIDRIEKKLKDVNPNLRHIDLEAI